MINIPISIFKQQSKIVNDYVEYYDYEVIPVDENYSNIEIIEEIVENKVFDMKYINYITYYNFDGLIYEFKDEYEDISDYNEYIYKIIISKNITYDLDIFDFCWLSLIILYDESARLTTERVMNCINLKELHIPDNRNITSIPSSVEILNANYCCQLTNESIINCVNLKKLDISGNLNITSIPSTVEALYAYHCNQLTNDNVANCINLNKSHF